MSPFVVTGLGHVVLPHDAEGCDSRPYLRVPKSRKFMGQQDELAVVAAGRALASARLGPAHLGEHAGLFVAVGYIPFAAEDIDALIEASLDPEGALSMAHFSTTGSAAVSPLLTFRCLPNMPAYHISANFDVQGPYMVSYPGPGQLYGVLEQALLALSTGHIDRALVGGVADQRNFLVAELLARLEPPVPFARLLNAAGFLVLETAEAAERRGAAVLARLRNWQVAYHAHAPFTEAPVPSEHFRGVEALEGELGVSSLPVTLSHAHESGAESLSHTLASRDGILAESTWDLLR